MYFRANNTRAHGLGVEFTDMEQIDIELQQGRAPGGGHSPAQGEPDAGESVASVASVAPPLAGSD
ncbi:hypothetical protein ACWCP6_34950 [Streptomyces sp. NPDC002004]